MLSKGNFERKRHKQRFVSYMCQTLCAGNGLPHDYEHRDRCALARAQAEPRNTFSVRVEVLVCAGQHVSQERNIHSLLYVVLRSRVRVGFVARQKQVETQATVAGQLSD